MPGAFFEETGRPLAILTDDFLAELSGGMMEGPKRKKDSLDLDWNA